MPDLEFRITGLDDLGARFEAVGRGLVEELAPALTEEAEAIMTDSKTQYVPVDQGVLRDSGVVLPPTWTDRVLSVVMGFGGAAAAYALAVHEHLSEHSPPSWRLAEASGHPVHFTVGGPKYLERPFLARIPGMGERLRNRLARRAESFRR